jgi:hypothetical protein
MSPIWKIHGIKVVEFLVQITTNGNDEKGTKNKGQ